MAGIQEMLHKPVFEKLGESQVRLQFASQTDDVGREARAWLHELQINRDLEASAKRDAREEETLSIAKEANRIASEARTAAFEQVRWAKWAAIIATVAAITAVVFSK